MASHTPPQKTLASHTPPSEGSGEEAGIEPQAGHRGLSGTQDSYVLSSALIPPPQVCREYQRGSCSRGETECKFAHPDEQITIDSSDNTVTVCMDHVKGRCSREKCKYFHPPLHLQAKIKAAQQQGSNPNLAGVVSR